ncbi:ATP-binding protein [Candidatus Peregrinibacteria bacterium]|nr:MAG: ATP-binding protein [Candidatus Peregrinibacteria bacterium]
MYRRRLITDRLKFLVETFPVVVLSGARQVGKSTLLNHEFGAGFDYIVFDPVIDIGNARQDPELFLDHHPTPLILDEIQYAPDLLAVIKRRVDKNRKPGQYIITGSQQWGVMKSISESLAGRAVFLDLPPFSFYEINDDFSPWLDTFLKDPEAFLRAKHSRPLQKTTLYEQLWRGFYPEAQVIPLETVPDYYQSYIRSYIERDVRLMADISNLQLFNRFVALSAALSAQEVNYSQMGREFGLSPQTARHYLDLLKASFQWFEIPAFSGNLIKRLSRKPKGYCVDTGLVCALQAISSPQSIASHPLLGALFETAVVMELHKQCSAMSTSPKLYHWRLHSGSEVDLILEKDGRYFPIEIKADSHPKRSDARGIQAFREAYPRLDIGPGIILAPTENSYPLTKNDFVLPWDLVIMEKQ